MMIFDVVLSLMSFGLMFIFFLMPFWLLVLILKIKYRKSSTIILTDDELRNRGLFYYLFYKNKYIWLNSIIILVLVYFGYKFTLENGCEGMGCLMIGVLLAPFILSFITIGLTLIVTLISSIKQFYFPEPQNLIFPKYIKIFLYLLIFISIVYILWGKYIISFFNNI